MPVKPKQSIKKNVLNKKISSFPEGLPLSLSII